MKHSVNAQKAHSDLQQALDRMLKVLKNLNDSLHVVGLKGFPVSSFLCTCMCTHACTQNIHCTCTPRTVYMYMHVYYRLQCATLTSVSSALLVESISSMVRSSRPIASRASETLEGRLWAWNVASGLTPGAVLPNDSRRRFCV